MKKNGGTYQKLPFPKSRLLMMDGGQLGRQKHTVHGLFELDVSCPRQQIRAYQERTGEKLSFSAFIITCLGQAIEADKSVQAYRDGRNRMIIFEEVDVSTLFEVELDGRKLIRPHIIRAANRRSLLEIHQEIRSYQQEHTGSQEARWIDSFVRLPGFVRRLFLRRLFKNPHRLKELMGTVLLTSVGTSTAGGFWGIPVPNHSLQLTLGGISEKPAVVGGQILAREFLSVTLSFDHDLIDGAPAARFVQRFKELVESGSGLASLLDQP
jgi:pyruvate/2-oxoglutarate dehydrogenase complex dihydrolipoamide acyltransferase (E2) component